MNYTIVNFKTNIAQTPDYNEETQSHYRGNTFSSLSSRHQQSAVSIQKYYVK